MNTPYKTTVLLLTALLFSATVGAQPQSLEPVSDPEPVQIDLSMLEISDVKVPSGSMFSSLGLLPEGESMEDFNYVTEEYFISGMAAGSRYTTRIVVRKPIDNTNFSGLILAESMHPSGNAWMFHYTHRYTMDSGHIGVEILTANSDRLKNSNSERYSELHIEEGQTNDILAQVGAFLKSDSSKNPLNSLVIRKIILAGTSESANVLIGYLPTHTTQRLSAGKPIYDGFLPTSNAVEIQEIDVPLVHVPTMSEIERARLVLRQDSDEAGKQYRLYELAGIAHLDSRDTTGLQNGTCAKPVSMHPVGTGFSTALHHLFQWVDTGVAPPNAERILVDRNTKNDGSLMALDNYGNTQGGLPSPYVNVPIAKYGVHNEANPNSDSPASRICFLAGYQYEFTKEQLKSMYGNVESYRETVQVEVAALVEAGWLMSVDVKVVMGDAQRVDF